MVTYVDHQRVCDDYYLDQLFTRQSETETESFDNKIKCTLWLRYRTVKTWSNA